MLNDIEFPTELNKDELKDLRKDLSEQLVLLQQRCKLEGLPVVLLIEGWGSSGKGSRISDLVVDLDPRLFTVYTTEDPIGNESRLPFMTRFWQRIGRHGHMTIFDRAWYDQAARGIIDAFSKSGNTIQDLSHLSFETQETIGMLDETTSELNDHVIKSLKTYYSSIKAIERQLVHDGYKVIKIFLHVTKEVQRERFISLLLNEDTSWKIDREDVRQIQHYEDYYEIYDKLLEMSNMELAPWHVLPAHNKHLVNAQIVKILVDEISQALDDRKANIARQELKKAEKNLHIEQAKQEVKAVSNDPEKLAQAESDLLFAQIGDISNMKSRYELQETPRLDEVRHDLVLDKDSYKEELKIQQDKLSELQMKLYRLRIPTILVYEGWDAAGKGGNIKRVASALDARSYTVHPISAATADELAHPFLWRFWTKIPRSGHIAIFDRSWYGRVMVERVEGFAREGEWKRAFDEINEFEEELTRWGALLIKFWINVSSEEQLKRFEERRDDPAKRWKLTDEDWRNREKQDLYTVAINDMLRLTSTVNAPWHIIESDDKRYARIKALKIINETMSRALL
ncbi:MAG: polyphosphate--AMP phosphotransferase [Coriobacteriia bacterium]|nr:polyphosphate--AMP phosphotransferase [Coriobacteriia bacterium]